jgi:mono/diheme cytochrome c family protein
MTWRAILLLTVLAAGPAAAKVKPNPEVTQGRHIARRVCAACHSVEAGGKSPAPKAPPFASREMRHTAGLEGRLSRLTSEGHYDMPPQNLSPDQVRALLAYIESLGRR